MQWRWETTPDSLWYQHSSFNWGRGRYGHGANSWTLSLYPESAHRKQGSCSPPPLELQKRRRFKVSCWPPIPKIIFPFVFSQPGNPSSNPSKSLFLSSKPSSCSVSHKEGEQLAVSEEQQPSKPAHPSVLQDSSVSDTWMLNTFSSLPHWYWWMQSPAGPAKHYRKRKWKAGSGLPSVS